MKKSNIIVVDDNDDFKIFLMKHLSREYPVQGFSDGESALKHLMKEETDLALVDLKLPGISGLDLLKRLKDAQPSTEVILMTGHSSVETAIEAIKSGAFDYLTKPCRMSELDIVMERALERKFLKQKNDSLERQFQRNRKAKRILGETEKIKTILDLARKTARSEASVLIQGESGTGKELIAYEIHQHSPRKKNPYVVVDCSVLQENLLENELFGHEKGSFTDARSAKSGLIELADGGTLFLDEIGELGKNLQAKLLRVLETNEFRRVGGTRTLKVDIRVISATNRDLSQGVREKNFREDLYYRINTMTLNVPSLRDRKEDIPIIAKYFLDTTYVTGARHKEFEPVAMQALMNYPWPGNVRELKNVIERAVILSESDMIRTEDIKISPTSELQNSPVEISPINGADLDGHIDQIEKEIILKTLQECRYSVTDCAKALKLSRQRLYRKLSKYKINVESHFPVKPASTNGA